MATSTINEKFVVKNKKAFKQLEKALENKSSFSDIKTLTAEEIQKGNEVALKWLSRQSEN